MGCGKVVANSNSIASKKRFHAIVLGTYHFFLMQAESVAYVFWGYEVHVSADVLPRSVVVKAIDKDSFHGDLSCLALRLCWPTHTYSGFFLIQFAGGEKGGIEGANKVM